MTSAAYIQYYSRQSGGSLHNIGPVYIRSRVKQRGRGIGSVFGTLYRFIRPLISSLAPAFKSSAISAASGIINDIGKVPFKESLKTNSKNAVQSFINSAQHQSGSGRKTKKKRTDNIKPKSKLTNLHSHTRRRKGNVKKKSLKKRVLDIFSH